jgi:hypothetical protein
VSAEEGKAVLEELTEVEREIAGRPPSAAALRLFLGLFLIAVLNDLAAVLLGGEWCLAVFAFLIGYVLVRFTLFQAADMLDRRRWQIFGMGTFAGFFVIWPLLMILSQFVPDAFDFFSTSQYAVHIALLVIWFVAGGMGYLLLIRVDETLRWGVIAFLQVDRFQGREQASATYMLAQSGLASWIVSLTPTQVEFLRPGKGERVVLSRSEAVDRVGFASALWKGHNVLIREGGRAHKLWLGSSDLVRLRRWLREL